MSERSTMPEAMPEGAPPWVVLNLDDVGAQVSGVLVTGTVVLLLSGSRDRNWAASAALQLCETWAASGRRVVVADLHLEQPLLRGQAATPELEGIVDLFLYGASLSRIATPSSSGAYYIIPAGTYAPDTGEVFRHPRWNKLIAGFRDTQATLLLFVPIESPGLAELSAWSNEAILLGSAALSGVVRQLGSSGIKVVAAIQPAAGASTGAEVVAATAASRPPAGDGRQRGPDGGETGTAQEADPEKLDLPPPPARKPLSKRAQYMILAAVLVVVVVGVTLYLLASFRPDLIPPPTPSEAAALMLDGTSASPEGEVLSYSVQVKAFPSLSAAREQLLIEQQRVPSTFFFISPEEIQGVAYYKIMAGLASDTIAATELRDLLVGEGSIEPEEVGGTWSLIQETPLAFHLGEFESLAEALSRADTLLLLGVPSYPVEISYSDGSRRWQLYGGAYRDSFHAARMERMLADAGVTGQFTIRAGIPETISE